MILIMVARLCSEIFGMESFYNEIQELHKARQEEEAKKEEANAGDKRKLEENGETKEEKKDEEPPTKTLKVDGDEQPKAQS